MDVVTTLSAFVELGARWVLWLLIALSIAGLAVIVERALFLLGTRGRLSKLRTELASHLDSAATNATHFGLALKRLDESPSTEARLTAAALRGGVTGSPEERVAAERSLERLRLERGISFLGTLATAAPFVGLLGTVIGIVAAFHQLAQSQGRLTGALMSEIGEALVATAVGLLVALPALAAFNTFQRIIQVRLTRGEALAREAMASLGWEGAPITTESAAPISRGRSARHGKEA